MKPSVLVTILVLLCSLVLPLLFVPAQMNALNPGVPGAPRNLDASAYDGSVTLTWQAPASPGDSEITGYNVSRSTIQGSLGTIIPLGNVLTYGDSPLTNGVIYYYRVCALNDQGEGEWTSEVPATPAKPAAVPNAPVLSSADPSNGQVTLSWTKPDDGGNAITGYKVYRGTEANTETYLDTVGDVATYTDMTVTNGQTYYYQVTAVNDIGESARSNERSATPTAPATRPSAPTLNAPTAGDGQVTLSWSKPDDGGDAITGYNIYRGTSSGGESLITSAIIALSYTDTGLTNGATYYYQVTAVNGIGESERSNERSATPVSGDTVPGAPILNSGTAGNGQVTLSWSAPSSDGGSSITNYLIYRGSSAGSGTLIATEGIVLTYVDTGVTNGATYYYKVSAKNGVGEGARSNELSAVPATVPGAPTLNSATAGNAQVTLSWSAPSSNGGNAVTSYKIYRGTSAGSESYLTTVGNVLSYTNGGLANGQVYFYRVSAVNAAGEGALSNEASATPAAPNTVPGAPTLNSATAGNGQVTLSWTAPSSDGGTAITGYKVYRGTATNGETLLTTLGAVSSYTDTGLTNGQRYFYKVSAVNAVGDSALSNELSTVPATVPGAPVLNSATAGNGQVTLSWSAPSSNGGSPVTLYSIYRGAAPSGMVYLDGVENVLSFVDTSVINGQTYYYEVAAVNDIGESARSNQLTARPVAPVAAPGAPGDLRAKASDGRIDLSWVAPADNGGKAITGYKIYRGTSSTSLGYLATTVGTTFSDSTITSGVLYHYQVSAMNPDEGNRSAVISAIFTVRPSIPTDLTAAGGNGFITLTWSAPGSDGGSPITEYKVYRGLSHTTLSLWSSTNDTSFTDLNVEEGVNYTYAVSAVNSVGESERSSTVSASSFSVLSAPSVPQDLMASVNDGNVLLNWTAPAADGGSPVTGYNVFRGVSSEVLIPFANTTDPWYLDTTTVKGMTYYYAITAMNSLGESARSSELNVTISPYSIPSEPLDLTARAENGMIMLTWSAPSQSGGSAITKYMIFRGTSPETLAYITLVTTLSYQDTGRSPGTTYYYSIVAINEAGTGPSAPVVSALLPGASLIGSGAEILTIAGISLVGATGIVLLVRRNRGSQKKGM